MSVPDRLTVQLDALATRLADDPEPPPAADLWRAGSRRRWRERGLAAAAVAAVLAVAAGVVLPGSGTPETMPAADPGVPVTGYPTDVAPPWREDLTGPPGATALVVAPVDAREEWHVVSPTGRVRTLATPSSLPVPASPSLSPDGLLLQEDGLLVVDLRTGRSVVDEVTLRTARNEGLTALPGVWSPDSALLAAPLVGRSATWTTEVRLVNREGRVSRLPELAAGREAALAGWLDDRTLLAVAADGGGPLRVWSWTVGADAWAPGARVPWDRMEGTDVLSASLSPDGTRLLVGGATRPADAETAPAAVQTHVVPLTRADVEGRAAREGTLPAGVDEVRIAPAGGTRCPVVWRDGRPLATSGDVVLPGDPDRTVVRVSSSLGGGCVTVAGGALTGSPVDTEGSLWRERARTALPWALVTLAAALALGTLARRRSWREGSEPLPTTLAPHHPTSR
ncbi:WD40 repeat domain-containing protein [Phycicoccus flavus]|uniref:hypothetical protein n=1 Tax=Phycicoccus flavus TaxID=2502783 RepID=UPI000FEB6D64|nr:hypothetical protein [Phycicoccus flavus]NHA69374.1 hypothetical protein [Phycicoccus flavus]